MKTRPAPYPKPEIVDRPLPAEMVGEDRPDDDVLILTIHDGAVVPRSLFGKNTEHVLDRPAVYEAYLRERDWGANRVARELARELRLGGYLRVNLARLVMDYGRFPGSSSGDADYLHRRAVYSPFHDLLSEEAKHEVLGNYDEISDALTGRIATKKVMISIHTYDSLNESGTVRPEISLVSRLLEYQINSTMPPDAFDPLFPPILCESTCHRLLSYQALVNLETGGGYRSALNYPYVMPVGSIEIRAQVWFFFRHLRHGYEDAYPESAADPAHQRVWQMLSDVVRRSWRSEALRGFLHEYRDGPRDERRLFAEARRAYSRIRDFLNVHRDELVGRYRFAPERPSCLGIEIRKDLLSEIDIGQRRLVPRDDADDTARDIARRMAGAVCGFLDAQAHS